MAKKHTRLDCAVPPSNGNSPPWRCPICRLVWNDTGHSRTSFLGAVLGSEREDDGSRARLLFKPRRRR